MRTKSRRFISFQKFNGDSKSRFTRNIDIGLHKLRSSISARSVKMLFASLVHRFNGTQQIGNDKSCWRKRRKARMKTIKPRNLLLNRVRYRVYPLNQDRPWNKISIWNNLLSFEKYCLNEKNLSLYNALILPRIDRNFPIPLLDETSSATRFLSSEWHDINKLSSFFSLFP